VHLQRSGEEDVHDGTKIFCPFAEGREFFFYKNVRRRFLSITQRNGTLCSHNFLSIVEWIEFYFNVHTQILIFLGLFIVTRIISKLKNCVRSEERNS
jgi:hypothetical protein